MALWQSDLRVSWYAQLISLLLHGAVILLLLLAPWPADYTVVWIALLTLVIFECVRSQRRIGHREGRVVWLDASRWRWRKQSWFMVRRPWLLPQGALVTLRNAQGQRERLWLMRDSMDEADWRALRQQIIHS